jgi:ornithine cyclodeaminase
VKIRVIDGPLLRRLSERDAMAVVLREAMMDASAGHCVLPLRWGMALPDARGALGMMPGYLGSRDVAGIKLVSLVPPAHRGDRPSHLGLMLLYDARGLQPVAMLCGATLTALRTAACTALATDTLARADCRVLAILGTGEQAQAHVEALRAVRRFDEIRIWGRSREHAAALVHRSADDGPATLRVVGTVEEAVRDADVICTTTSSRTPVLPGAMVPPGAHVNLVGSSTRDAAETDATLVQRSKFFVDLRASAMTQAAELLQAIELGVVTAGCIAAEIGEVLAGTRPGRTTADEITVYKSLGIAAQDLAVASHAFRLAEAQDLGTTIHL